MEGTRVLRTMEGTRVLVTMETHTTHTELCKFDGGWYRLELKNLKTDSFAPN